MQSLTGSEVETNRSHTSEMQAVQLGHPQQGRRIRNVKEDGASPALWNRLSELGDGVLLCTETSLWSSGKKGS